MSNQAFKSDFARLIKKAGDRANEVVRASALGLQASMVARAPVDTGRFKSNFMCGISAPNLDTSAAAGIDALGPTASALNGWKPGQTIWLTNNLPYARRLEFGWSKQAPAGVVRLALQEFKLDIAEKAK